jgi:sialic acid synthase SpsE
MAKTVHLGDVAVGADHPTLFLPEIGLYFRQDIGQARESIQKVRDAGCKVIKGEIAHTAEIVLKDGYIYQYETHTEKRARPYREIIEEIVLPMSTWYELWGACHDLGLTSIISAYDKIAVDFVKDVGGGCIKISSNNVVNVPLIRHAAKTGLPLIIDTGKASLEEVARALDTARDAGCDGIIVNHAPEGHPAKAADHNLRIIETYSSAFDCPIGLADHYRGEEIMYAAAALNYSVIEKPVVPVPEQIDVDAPWTMRIDDIADVRKKIEACWRARGMTFRPKRYAAKSDHPARMGLVTARSIRAGETLDESNVRFAWPRHGISVYDWDLVAGATFTHDIGPDTPIYWNDVQPHSET